VEASVCHRSTPLRTTEVGAWKFGSRWNEDGNKENPTQLRMVGLDAGESPVKESVETGG
jgi:hypothetical protein